MFFFIIQIFRWVRIPGTELLPGDIVSIGRSVSGEDRSVPADMLLLAGSAIVNEAILTGESTPQWKVPPLLYSLILIYSFLCGETTKGYKQTY